MAPKLVDVSLLRIEFDIYKEKIEKIITAPSKVNLVLLGKKKIHLVELRNRIEKIPAEKQSQDVIKLLVEVFESISTIDDIESTWEIEFESDLNSSIDSNGQPKKKRSKANEFEELVKVYHKTNDFGELVVNTTIIIKDLEADNERVKFERDVAVAKLNLRPFVVKLVKLEENIIPLWLHNYNFPIKLKLVISIRFQLTVEAAVLFQRCAKSKPTISVERVAMALCLVYRKSSKEINHDDNPGAVILTDEQWNIIFKDIEITEPLDQEAVKLALRVPDRTEFDGIEKEEQKEIKYTYMLYVNQLPINFNLGTEAAKDGIIEVCGSEYENDFGEFYFPVPNAED